MSTVSSLPEILRSDSKHPVVEFTAEGFPRGRHSAEADIFSRQTAMPRHNQQKLEDAHLVLAGCGGLGSWIAVSLARMGVRRLTLSDPDVFDVTNAPRQLMFPEDLGLPKAHVLARHVARHMTNTGIVRGINGPLAEAIRSLKYPPSALVIAADNNAVRLLGSQFAREMQIPAGFAMLSTDGSRVQAFLQEPAGACLSCVLPNLDRNVAAPCAAAAMAPCLLAGAHLVSMVASHLMSGRARVTWRETSLDATTERTGAPRIRVGCACAKFEQ